MILYSAIGATQLNVKRYAVLIYLGQISYGLYVFHLLAIKLAEMLAAHLNFKGMTYFSAKSFSALAITIILSMLSYSFLEKPFLKLKKKFTVVNSRPV